MSRSQNKTFYRLLFRTFGLLIFSLTAAGLWIAARPAPQTEDMETCGTCHEEVVKAFLLKPHSAIEDKTCTGCHGPGEKHIEEGGKGEIFAFNTLNLPVEKTEKCFECHAKDLPRYMNSPHGKSALDCTTCHAIHTEEHNTPLLKTRVDKNCSFCHEDIFAQFQLNERHRLQEGILSCATCHNPHEPATRQRLGGFKAEECLKCHTDKGGPFLYEHEASQVEGCSICHEVHGSPNRHLLNYQSVADLCFSCHAAAPASHANFTSETNCVTCHTTIHGSNLSKIFLK